MSFRAICVALLLSSLPIAGCGTVVNLSRSDPEGGGKTPFGGVRQDVSCIEKAASGEFGFKARREPEVEQHAQVALMLFCAADLPFSLIGDVVTWPYTAAYSCVNQPVPTPPVTLAPAPVLPPTAPLLPESKGPEATPLRKGDDQGKKKDDTPAQKPMPPPQAKSEAP